MLMDLRKLMAGSVDSLGLKEVLQHMAQQIIIRILNIFIDINCFSKAQG